MPWQSQQVWTDEQDGPQAFSSVKLLNQKLWDVDPISAAHSICRAISTGGFGGDHIRRKVGNYEGQIMAIRAGLVSKENYGWRITDAGREFLRDHGKPVPIFLTALDDWHNTEFEYCVWETERDGNQYLKFAKELYPRISTGMNPLFRIEDAIALRDYLTKWIDGTVTKS